MEPRPNERDFVVKVKYGDTLKRFSAYVHGEIIEYNMTRLRNKIISLFKLSPEADIVLTYVDEDGEIVALDDDDELRDAAINQHLNPLRINVQLKSNNSNGQTELKQENVSSATAVPQKEENQPPELSSVIDEALRRVPEPFRTTLSKMSQDILSKAASSSPAIADMVDYFSKLGMSNLSQPVNSSMGESSGISSQTTRQSEDLNVSGEQNVSNTSAPASTIISDQVPEYLQKQHESVSGSQVDAVKTHTTIDLNVDSPHVPTSEQAPEYPALEEFLISSWINNEISDHQKESDNVSRRGKSVAATTPLLVPSEQFAEQIGMYNPYPAPTVPCGFTGTVIGHSSKLPTGAAPLRGLGGFSFQGGKLHTNAATADIPFAGPISLPYQRDDWYNDNMLHTFHRGIRCDGCGMHPIVGPRFKSNMKEDYDLCSICFSEMGNEADYTRIDRAQHFSRRMFKDCHNTHSKRRFSSPHFHCSGGGQSRAKLESLFIKDVTVFDGTLMPPSTPFTKIWRLRNSGCTRWPYGTRLVWVGGDRFSNRDSVLLEIPFDGFPANEEVDIAVDLTSPAVPGRYFSYWRLSSPSGQKFGQRVWVLIQVDVSPPNSVSGGFGADLNLNLPPEISSRDGPGIIDVNAVPFDDVTSEPILSNTSDELVKPHVNQIPTDVAHPSTTDEIARPLPAVDPPVSYPIIDVSEHVSSSYALPSATVTKDNAVEETLLRELEAMGFKQIDLNKEILRLNKYDLEQSVDDLCGYSEWDPLLEELQEMGFSDRAKNKKLLVKNGGSIKRVVLDLIAGEKA